MSTLSERMVNAKPDDLIQLGIWIVGWAAEVEVLEDALKVCTRMYASEVVLRQQDLESPNELSPKDKLMQAYEKAGMANVFHIEQRYGKHSAQGYKRHDK